MGEADGEIVLEQTGGEGVEGALVRTNSTVVNLTCFDADGAICHHCTPSGQMCYTVASPRLLAQLLFWCLLGCLAAADIKRVI